MDENVPMAESRSSKLGTIGAILQLCLAVAFLTWWATTVYDHSTPEKTQSSESALISQEQESFFKQLQRGDLIMVLASNPETVRHLPPSEYCFHFIKMHRRDATTLLVDITSYDGKASHTVLVEGTPEYAGFIRCL